MAIPVRPSPVVGSRRPRAGPLYEVKVLGDFEVTRRGSVVALPESTWRLVALLAISGQALRRHRVALTLWPDVDDERAQGNLRSCLWRLRKVAPGLLGSSSDLLGLDAGVRVDLADLTSLSTRVEAGDPLDAAMLQGLQVDADLLPDFDDDFVDENRELVRQLWLRTVEAVAQRLLDGGAVGPALRLALVVVSQAPMRETAHELILRAHLAEGNTSEALRHYRALSNTLWAELGIRPSGRMRATMAPWTHAEERAEYSASPGRSTRCFNVKGKGIP